MSDIVIKIEDAVVSYREDVALRGVSLEVRREEFIGVLGPNGAGKTTLLTLINGLGKLQRGRVWVLGNGLNNGKAKGELRKEIGYVAQIQNIDPRMPIRVREVVMIGRYGRLGLLHPPRKSDWEIVDKAIELVGLSHLADRPIGHLSGGEQQKVAIARALAQEPEIFLLDEPTASLDWQAQREILGLVKKIHELKKLSTLIVTHDLKKASEYCDRVVLMKEGRIWREGNPKTLLNQEILSQLFGLPVLDPLEPP